MAATTTALASGTVAMAKSTAAANQINATVVWIHRRHGRRHLGQAEGEREREREGVNCERERLSLRRVDHRSTGTLLPTEPHC